MKANFLSLTSANSPDRPSGSTDDETKTTKVKNLITKSYSMAADKGVIKARAEVQQKHVVTDTFVQIARGTNTNATKST